MNVLPPDAVPGDAGGCDSSVAAPDDGAAVPLLCDFTGGALAHRLRAGFGRHQPLARAVGIKPGYAPRIVDATAGLGRDAFLLASLGLEVTLVERSPTMHALLADGLARAAAADSPARAIVARMTLVAGDARDHLAGLRPDVVLVDPMHPPRRKAALVKKAMRVVRDVVGTDADALDLMRVARAAARSRVVLKWPLRAAPMEGLPPPSHAIVGKTLRFDVFMTPAGAGGA